MNREQIKLIAIMAMTVNHIAFAFLSSQTILYQMMLDIGYITAVTMCYFLVEGYYFTHSKVAYMQRLLLTALVSQVPYTIALDLRQLNMLFTLLICFLILLVIDKIKSKVLMISLVSILFCLTYFCDWSFKAAAFTILFTIAYKEKKRFVISYSAAFFIQFALSLYRYQQVYPIICSVILAFGSSIGVIISGYFIVKKYNGKCTSKHRNFWRWLFYIYYPVHLSLLGALKIGFTLALFK